MKGVNDKNYFLYKEEYDLMTSLDKDVLSSIQITSSPVNESDNLSVYKILQEYNYNGKYYSCSYDARFLNVNGKLLYDGLFCNHADRNGATVQYPDGYESVANLLAEDADAFLNAINAYYTYTPDPGICIKVYDDQDIFLQSIKFDLPDWVGGWHEFGESIKIYWPYKNYEVDPATVYHETTHWFLSEITNDNAAYWIQEGLATLFETNLTTGLDNMAFLYNNDIVALAENGGIWDLEKLSSTNPEELTDIVMVRGYYALSALCVKHIIDTVGIERFLDVMDDLKSNDVIRTTASEKINETNNMSVRCLCSLLNTDEPEFYDMIDQYLLSCWEKQNDH